LDTEQKELFKDLLIGIVMNNNELMTILTTTYESPDDIPEDPAQLPDDFWVAVAKPNNWKPIQEALNDFVGKVNEENKPSDPGTGPGKPITWTAVTDSAFGEYPNQIIAIAWGKDKFVAVGNNSSMAYFEDGTD
jgi:hypothetical protein